MILKRTISIISRQDVGCRTPLTEGEKIHYSNCIELKKEECMDGSDKREENLWDRRWKDTRDVGMNWKGRKGGCELMAGTNSIRIHIFFPWIPPASEHSVGTALWEYNHLHDSWCGTSNLYSGSRRRVAGLILMWRGRKHTGMRAQKGCREHTSAWQPLLLLWHCRTQKGRSRGVIAQIPELRQRNKKHFLIFSCLVLFLICHPGMSKY